MAPSQRAHWINKQAAAVMTNKGHLIFLHTAFTDLWKQETQNQEPDVSLKPQQQTGAQWVNELVFISCEELISDELQLSEGWIRNEG